MNKSTPFFESEEGQSLLEAVDMLKLLANPHRLAILCHLGEREMSVTEITSLVGLSQSALSQHLAKLREQELVQTRRDQQTIYYSLRSKEVQSIIGLLRELYCRTSSSC